MAGKVEDVVEEKVKEDVDNAAAKPGGNKKDSKKDCKNGDHVLALWLEEEDDWREAEVIQIKEQKDGSTMYYVHWCDFNRRLDSWVKSEDIDWTATKEKIRDAKAKRANFDKFTHEGHDDHEGLDEASLKEHEEVTKIKNVNKIQMGKYIVETWYFSPLPREIWKQGDDIIDVLYICEFTLNFYKSKSQLERHQRKGCPRHPPGDEIYRRDNVSVFEVDGAKAKVWCQNLCYLAKLFLDHKTLYYDVDPFNFYVMTEVDQRGCHVVGYFSKEKESPDDHNLACIMVLPPHQRKRYGRFLITFSYELSKMEGRVGTPERPLSDLGLLGYRSYWKSELLEVLSKNRGNLSIKDISQLTSIKPDDIITTLQSMGLIKYWKGQHLISVSPKVIEDHLARITKAACLFEPSKLRWTPPAPMSSGPKKAR
mmetsp:Transcript_13304/g.30886  ORF Transcript_13304/g.30886 Transcript_13304/m.30886 type:complete len:424 (-) Transcript_13304:124-1395(-)